MRTAATLLLSCFVLLCSCQKELHFGYYVSEGILKSDSAFDCFPSSVHGDYVQSHILLDSNYIDVQVNTALSGAYTIQSDTVNGYSFYANGYFDNTGLNIVRLYATGTPTIPGTNSFIINYDSSFCIIDVDVQASQDSAQYTFGGSGSACTGVISNGIYVPGIATISQNTITVNVNVTTPGNYFISTSTQNGISFSASGFFATASTQPVVLTAGGTPLVDGDFTFDVNGNGTSCSFQLDFQSTNAFSADVDGVHKNFLENISSTLSTSAGQTILYFEGYVLATQYENIGLEIEKLDGTAIPAGVYDVNQPAPVKVIANYSQVAGVPYIASSDGLIPTDPFTITLMSITNGPSGRIIGTFSGTMPYNAQGPDFKVITNGVFNLPLQ